MSELTQGFAGLNWKASARAGKAWEQLASLPVDNPERNKLRDVVRVEGDALAARAHKYLTLAAEYNERKRLAWDIHAAR